MFEACTTGANLLHLAEPCSIVMSSLICICYTLPLRSTESQEFPEGICYRRIAKERTSMLSAAVLTENLPSELFGAVNI